MDNAPDLLSKEATLLSGGIAAGIWQRGADIADKPVAAAAAVTATSAITGGLAYAAERFAPEIALTAGKMVLGAAIILEAARGASDVLSAVSDTWHNPHGNAAKDKQLIADSLGKPLVDAAIFGAVGFGSAYAGAKAGGRRQNNRRLPGVASNEKEHTEPLSRARQQTKHTYRSNQTG